ncbi:MAG: ribonuclease P protein component 4 [Nanoarchaeota archaeon]|nr:ribonuclease P protein component 4 [Nanoarchaeota archaeon]
MKRGFRGRKEKQASIAKERIEKLFSEAEAVFNKEPKLAKRYVELARKISTRTNTRIPFALKRKFCKKCNAFLVPGKNARIRTKNKAIIIACLECSALSKLPFGKKKAENATGNKA